jgi:PII-like signaling protein
MLSVGPAKKVTVHLNDDTVGQNDYIYSEVFSLLYSHGVSGATLIRPDASFGSHHHIHSQRLANRGEERHLPVRIEFIEAEEKVAILLPLLKAIVTDGLIEVQDTLIYHSAQGESSS